MIGDPRMSDLVIGGACALAVRDFGGSGPPVLLMHGLGRNLADLTGVAQKLAAEHRVVAMDLRGHGRSADAPWTWDDVLAVVDRVIAATGLGRPAIVGHSLGGMIAALHSARGGESSCIVNLDGYGLGHADRYPGIPPEEVAQFQRDLRREGFDARPDAAGPISAAGLERLRTASVAAVSPLGIPADVELATLDRSVRRLPGGSYAISPSIEALTTMYNALAEIDWFEAFAGVRVPFLIYNCVDDEAPSLEGGRRREIMAAYRQGIGRDLAAIDTPHLRVLTKRTHHMLILSMPDAVAAEIHEFVGSCP